MACWRIGPASELWPLLLCASLAAAQQTRYIAGTVYHADNSQPIAHAEVHIEGAGSDVATDSGEFRFPLRSPLRVGFPATFHVINWEVVNPCNLVRGRTYLPDPDAEVISLTVLPRGDRRLGTGESAKCVVLERASRFEVRMDAASRYLAWFRPGPPPSHPPEIVSRGTYPRGVSATQARSASYPTLFFVAFQAAPSAQSRNGDAFLEQQAKKLGFSGAELAAAINEWVKFPRSDYDKGLAALYEGQYEQARSSLSRSIPSPPGKLVLRYMPLSRAEYELGNYRAAESGLRRILDVYPEDPIVMNDLGVVLTKEAKLSDAKPIFERSLVLEQGTLGPQDPDVANTLSNLAEVYRMQGDFAAAEERYQRALVILGPASPALPTVLNNLGSLYDDENKPEDAQKLFQNALDIDRQELPPNHPDIARDLNNLGLFYRTYGGKAKYQEAEQLLKQALEIRRKALGENHPDVARTLSNLAGLYVYEDRLPEAESLAQRAVKIDEATLAAEHPDLATDLHNLATIYQGEQRYTEAEPLFRRALNIDEKALGSEHANVASASLGLASVYMEEHKNAEAEPLLERAFCTFGRALGPSHPKTRDTAIALAMNLQTLGRCSAARACLEQAAKLCAQ